jgi:hypothetical protein
MLWALLDPLGKTAPINGTMRKEPTPAGRPVPGCSLPCNLVSWVQSQSGDIDCVRFEHHRGAADLVTESAVLGCSAISVVLSDASDPPAMGKE